MSRNLLCAAGVATALATWKWQQLSLVGAVARDSIMILLVDNLPNSVRRKILASEYSGAALEERLTQSIFKGASTVRALWRMASINMRPQTSVGAPVPAIPVLLDGKEIMLASLAEGDRPLVLNFGSCT